MTSIDPIPDVLQHCRLGESKIWTEPVRDNDSYLLIDTTASQALGVTDKEAKKWLKRGWISFDVLSNAPVTSPQCSEVEFIMNMTRSGLSVRQIDKLLGFLDRPYQYDSELVAFHPLYGWVSPRLNTLRYKQSKRLLRRVRLLEEQIQILKDELEFE